MPQYDLYHNQVKHALIKEGWEITHDPFTIEFGDVRLFADLGAERVIAAAKQEQKIVVEIKVFGGLSLITELEKTIGQYNIYRLFLKETDPKRVLFLAIAQDVYQDFFQRMAIKKIISDQQIKLLIFDPEIEEIIQWIS